MKNKIVKLITAFFSVLVLVYVGYQVYLAYYSSIKTETVINMTAYETIQTDGIVIRDEQIIPGSGDGVYTYAAKNGERIPKGGVVARTYQSEDAAAAQQKILILEEEINDLSQIKTLAAGYTTQPELLDNQIDEKIGQLNAIKTGNRYSELEGACKDLVNLLNKRQLAADQSLDFSDRIKELKEQRDTLKNQYKESAKPIYAPRAGYFINETDGFETQLRVAGIPELTPESLREILAQKPETGTDAVGKIAGDYEWYFACVLSADEAGRLQEGGNITLEIPFAAVDEVPAQVSSINQRERGGEAVVILKCDYMTSGLALMRKQPIKLLLKKYSGLRISNNAVRIEDGERGVYVLHGSEVRFKKIESLHMGNGFFIIRDYPNQDDYVQLYDEIIVGGKKLYDGKILG